MNRTFHFGHYSVARKLALASTLWLCIMAIIPLNGVSDLRESQKAHKVENPGENHGSKQLKFEVIVQGDGRTDDGIPTYFTSFRSSNGSIVYETFIDFPSAARSAGALERLLKSSVKVLRSTPKTDKEGHEVGKLVVVLVPSTLPAKPTAVLAWTEGAHYADVRCDSLDDLLQFEKRFLNTDKKG